MAAQAGSADAQAKQCRMCGITKFFCEFVADKRTKDGVGARCKDCHTAAGRAWRINNPGKQRECEEAYRADNREIIKVRSKEYFSANKDAHADRVRSYRSRNPDKVAQFNATSHANRSSSPKYRVESAIRTAVNRTIRFGAKEARTFELLGYSSGDLMAHLERQFSDGMSWDNYGEWHIDHKTPLTAHEYETAEDADFKRAWALSNLQPLWALDNIKKGGRIIEMAAP